MSEGFAERFIRTLQEAERTGDAASLAGLFTDGAELSNLAHAEPMHGRDGALKFWSNYLAAFGAIRSRFHHVIAANGDAVLEWISDGTLPDGSPVSYRGVSVLQADGDRVAKFRTYYDSAAFVKTRKG